MVTYPVRSIRLAEIFGLAGLTHTGEERDAFASACRRIIIELPGTSHPLSDNWAVSIHCSVGPPLIWVGDHYEEGKLGLARALAPPEEELRHLLAGSLDFIEVQRRPESMIASVILDLAAALELSALYDDLINDILAVNAHPQVVECDDDMTQYRDAYPDAYLELWMRYDESMNTTPGWKCAPHDRTWEPHYLERIGRHWDSLAIFSVLRDRCVPYVIRWVGELPNEDP
jgi:hypothetical protein